MEGDATSVSYFFSTYIDRSSLEIASFFAIIINTILVFPALIFLAYQLRRMVIDRKHENLSAILERLSDHNNNVINDIYRKESVEIFMNLKAQKLILNHNKTVNKDNFYNKYWGARALFLGLLNLIMQAWLLSPNKKRLYGDYAGWQTLAVALAKELSGKNHNLKPEWYNEACQDIWKTVEQGRVYTPKFATWMKKLSEK